MLLLHIGREPVNFSKDDEYYKVLKSRQETCTKNSDTHKDYIFSSGSTVVVQREDRGPWMHAVIMHGNSNDTVAILLSAGEKDGQNTYTKHIRPKPVTVKQYLK